MSLLSTPDAVNANGLRHNLLSLYLRLAKARLSALVVVTTAVGFIMAPAPTGSVGFDWMRFVMTALGTALAAGGANALNQLLEIRRDGLMHRTRQRPLPSGELGVTHGLLVSLAMAYAGLAVLALTVNLAAAGLALITIVTYLALYTPLKTRTTLNTLAGAVCGAIPPMIGWVAASGRLDPGAWVLGVILFVWQIPHFFALAWLYREDYRRGGFAMLPVIDPDGRLTGQVVVVSSLLLLPVALAATLFGLAGWVYALGSTIAGLWLLSFGVHLLARRTQENAKRLFLASVIYLPVLLCLMVVDRIPPPSADYQPPAIAAAAVTPTPDHDDG